MVTTSFLFWKFEEKKTTTTRNTTCVGDDDSGFGSIRFTTATTTKTLKVFFDFLFFRYWKRKVIIFLFPFDPDLFVCSRNTDNFVVVINFFLFFHLLNLFFNLFISQFNFYVIDFSILMLINQQVSMWTTILINPYSNKHQFVYVFFLSIQTKYSSI